MQFRACTIRSYLSSRGEGLLDNSADIMVTRTEREEGIESRDIISTTDQIIPKLFHHVTE